LYGAAQVVYTPIGRWSYWLATAASVAACYVLAVLVGSRPEILADESNARYVFWTSFALCHAAVWQALSSPSERWTFIRGLDPRGRLQSAVWTACPLLVLPLACELGLRFYAVAVGDEVMTHYVTDALKLPPGGERLGRTVNSQGYWDDEFPRSVGQEQLRVAALGDEAVLCGDGDSNFLAQVERLLPGVEVLNFGLVQASPREYAAQLESAVAPCRPDVLLVFVSIGTDITEAPALPGPFDWRSLHLVQRSAGLLTHEAVSKVATRCARLGHRHHESSDWEKLVGQLPICRVPVPEPLESRWQAVYGHLDTLLDRCRALDIEPMVVALPCEFQVDDKLCQTLCRRAGFRPEQIDIDLPQRRLASYAKDRGVEMLDLSPHLRASRRPNYECNSEHFNEEGNSLSAAILSDWLETRYDGTLLADGS
jgi:hypothetical protein